MKSTEAYKEIREVIEPWCKMNGFKRLRSSIRAWYKPIDERFLILWFEVSKYGWIEGIGSSFYVGFQLSKSKELYSNSQGTFSKRLPVFLTSEEVEVFRKFRDEIVASLPLLPAASDLESIRELDLKNEDYNYDNKGDIWCRYYTAKDVNHWASLILPIISRVVSKLSIGIFPEEVSREYQLPPTDAPGVERLFQEQSIQLEGVVKGKAPVHGTGTLSGKPFSFRAQNTGWKFIIAIDGNGDLSAIDSSCATDGIFKDGENYYYFAHGYYGPEDEASHMRHSTAEQMIRKCVAEFNKHTGTKT